jgi:hypothetical protein
MITHSTNQLVRRIGLGIIVLLILFTTEVDVPPSVNKFVSALSYIIPGLVLSQWKKIIYVLTRSINIPIIILTIFAVSSVIWSTVPSATLICSRSLLRTTAFGVYLATRFSPKDQMRLLAWVFGIAAVSSFIITLAFPSYGISITNQVPTWTGINDTERNALCSYCNKKLKASLGFAKPVYSFTDAPSPFERKISSGNWVTLILLVNSLLDCETKL